MCGLQDPRYQVGQGSCESKRAGDGLRGGDSPWQTDLGLGQAAGLGSARNLPGSVLHVCPMGSWQAATSTSLVVWFVVKSMGSEA